MLKFYYWLLLSKFVVHLEIIEKVGISVITFVTSHTTSHVSLSMVYIFAIVMSNNIRKKCDKIDVKLQ